MKLTISVVATEDKETLSKCLDSINCNVPKNIGFEVYVVDNANNVSGFISQKHPRVKLIVNKESKGFSENHNNIIRCSSGEHVLIMNPDVYIQKGFVESMLKVINDEKIGIVAGKLLQPDGKIIDSTGHVIFKSRRTIDRGQGQVDSGQYNVQEEVFSACAAAMLCRREMLEDIKLFGEYFDGSFKLYKEDLDLCWRARLRGWKIVYTPEADAYHERGWGKERPRAEIGRAHV
jgi:GT2 family glycosyltransferase